MNGQTKELISFRNSSAILATFSKRIWLNHEGLTQSNRGKSIDPSQLEQKLCLNTFLDDAEKSLSFNQ